MAESQFMANPFLADSDGGNRGGYGQLFFSLAAGAGSATDIEVSDTDAHGATRAIKPGDKILAVLNLTTPGKQTVTEISAGNIQLAEVTSNEDLLVIWMSKRLT
jgi:hypothetical protein